MQGMGRQQEEEEEIRKRRRNRNTWHKPVPAGDAHSLTQPHGIIFVVTDFRLQQPHPSHHLIRTQSLDELTFSSTSLPLFLLFHSDFSFFSPEFWCCIVRSHSSPLISLISNMRKEAQDITHLCQEENKETEDRKSEEIRQRFSVKEAKQRFRCRRELMIHDSGITRNKKTGSVMWHADCWTLSHQKQRHSTRNACIMSPERVRSEMRCVWMFPGARKQILVHCFPCCHRVKFRERQFSPVLCISGNK